MSNPNSPPKRSFCGFTTSTERSQPSSGNQVLVVDDSPVERKILSRILSLNGLDYTEACDGVEALETIEVNLPELIILDVEMPRMNGYEVCRRLKNNSRTQMIPILMCTSKAISLDPYWGSREGANAYVSKPYQTNDLIRKVKLLLPIHHLSQGALTRTWLFISIHISIYIFLQ